MPFPGILGHEVSGIVEQVGPLVPGLKPGDHVVGTLTPYCGHCRNCVSGYQVHCEDTTIKIPFGKADRIFGKTGKISQIFNLSGFAEKMLVHYSSLVAIPKEMPLDRAALLGCAVLTGTGAVFRSAKVMPGNVVVVIGCGGIGLSTINGAEIAGAGRIIAVDVADKNLKWPCALARRTLSMPVKSTRSKLCGKWLREVSSMPLNVSACRSPPARLSRCWHPLGWLL